MTNHDHRISLRLMGAAGMVINQAVDNDLRAYADTTFWLPRLRREALKQRIRQSIIDEITTTDSPRHHG